MRAAPDGWRTSRLSRHVQILGGRDYSGVSDDGGVIPVYGSGGQFASAHTPLYSGEGVLFGRKGTVDQPRFLTGSFWITDTAYFVRPISDALDPRFLYYWACRFPFERYMTDTALPSMTSAGISSEPIMLPPAAEQRVIADYLDHETAEIDALIADLSTAADLTNERLAAQRENIIVTSGPVPTELRRHHPSRKSGTSVNGAPWPAPTGQPGVLKTGAASRRQYRPSENKAVIDPAEQARLTAPVEADRVLVNRANTPANVGAAAYVDNASDNLFLSDKLWSVNFDGINEYFALAMQTRLYQDQASQRAVGTSLSMQNLPYDEFLSIRIPVPPLPEQRVICAEMRALQLSTSSAGEDISHAIALAKERRAALITAAVTGQIDVTQKHRPAAEQLEEDLAL